MTSKKWSTALGIPYLYFANGVTRRFIGEQMQMQREREGEVERHAMMPTSVTHFTHSTDYFIKAQIDYLLFPHFPL